MKKIFFIFLLLPSTSLLIAQDKKEVDDEIPLNSINLNLVGEFSIFSFDYERLFFISPAFFLSGEIGLGYNIEDQLCVWGPCSSSKPENYLTIPHHITANLGQGRSFLEFGLGGTVISGNTTYDHYLFYQIIGYRFLPFTSGKVNFRGFLNYNICWLFNGGEPYDILPIPFGVSIGISF